MRVRRPATRTTKMFFLWLNLMAELLLVSAPKFAEQSSALVERCSYSVLDQCLFSTKIRYTEMGPRLANEKFLEA